jgi:hypothetical protein
MTAGLWERESVETGGRRNANAGDITRWNLLASAVSGRAVVVEPAPSGEPSWTDGRAIHLDPATTRDQQVLAVCVQGSLIAAGSLAPALMRALMGRPAAARRYLAVEGHRALAAGRAVTPTSVTALIDDAVAELVSSPHGSLAVASGRSPVPPMPAAFGVLRPREVLRQLGSGHAAAGRAPAGPGTVAPARRRVLDPKEDLDAADELVDSGPHRLADLMSGPVGRGGPIARLLERLLSGTRTESTTGPPGSDGPTRRTARPGRGEPVVVDFRAEVTRGRDPQRGEGIRYPEWDARRDEYRADWCTVREVAPDGSGRVAPKLADHRLLRSRLTRLAFALEHRRRQPQGDEIDIDAAIRSLIELRAGRPPDEWVYRSAVRSRRDLSVLLLLDVSGSVGQTLPDSTRVHDLQVAAAGALMRTLNALGDRVALYAYSSRGRAAVQLIPVKGFDEVLRAGAIRRLGALSPNGYSRLGAAIRHGTRVLVERAGTPRRLLVVLSDGLAYDHGYEREYGAADVRRALAEAQRGGTACVCLSIGSDADAHELRSVFGSAAYATVSRPDLLAHVVGPLFRTAIRSAEIRHRVR